MRSRDATPTKSSRDDNQNLTNMGVHRSFAATQTDGGIHEHKRFARETHTRPRTARCDDDRHRLDDRFGDLHRLRRIFCARRLARLVARGVGVGRSLDDYGRALLRRTCSDDAARGRAVCFPARSLRPGDRLSLRLVALLRHSNRHDCGGGRGLRRFSGSARARTICHQLLNSTGSSWKLRHQPFDAATRRHFVDCASHLYKHARLEDWQAHSKHFHFHEDCRAPWPHSHRLCSWLE